MFNAPFISRRLSPIIFGSSGQNSGGPGPQPPVALTVPTLSGAVAQGSTLTIAPGTWSGSPTLLYDWQRNSGTSGAWVTFLPRTTQITYASQAADVGYQVRAVEIGNNGVGGDVTQASNVLGPVTAATPSAPVSLTQPSLSGGKNVGNLLTVVPGTWSGTPPPTLTHKLQRRLGTTGTYVDYVNLTSLEYTIVPDDVGYQLRVVETANNGVGSPVVRNGAGQIGPVTDTSGTGSGGDDGGTSPVDPSTTAPVSLTAPTVSGYIEVGAPLTVDNGGWNGEPSSFQYRWMRGPSNSGPWETVVNYGPSNTWTPRPQDQGYFVLASVRAANAVGTTNRNANIIGAIAAQPADAPPSLTESPHILGNPAPGERLAAIRGIWAGYPRPALAIRWSRSLDGVAWTVIPDQSAQLYQVTEGDRYYQISFEEQATNSLGQSAWVRSEATAAVGDLVLPVYSQPETVALAATNTGIQFNPSFFKTKRDYGSTFIAQAQVVHANSTVCEMRTPYAPTNHVVHPFVIEMTPSFRGYRYLCAITALPGGVDYFEDPFLYGSNDRVNWEYVPGVANPLDTPPNAWSYHSDTFLSQDPRDGGLLVCWREVYVSAAGDKYVPEKTTIRLKYSKTLDGITWTAKAPFYEVLQSVDNCLAPAILYDPVGARWHMWACEHPQFHHYSAPELTGPWVMDVVTTTFPKVVARTATPHHGEVKWFGDKLVYLCSERWTGEQFIGVIDQANPSSITWQAHSIITADGTQPFPTYKASMLPIHDGNNWRLGLWYTGIGGTEKVFKFGIAPQVFSWSEVA